MRLLASALNPAPPASFRCPQHMHVALLTLFLPVSVSCPRPQSPSLTGGDREPLGEGVGAPARHAGEEEIRHIVGGSRLPLWPCPYGPACGPFSTVSCFKLYVSALAAVCNVDKKKSGNQAAMFMAVTSLSLLQNLLISTHAPPRRAPASSSAVSAPPLPSRPSCSPLRSPAAALVAARRTQ